MEANASDSLRLESPSEKDTVNRILSNWVDRRRTWDFGCFQDPVRWNPMLDIITTAIRALVRPESDIDFEFMFDQTGLTTFTRFTDWHFLVGTFLMLAIARYRPLHLVKARGTLPFANWPLEPCYIPHARRLRIPAAPARACLFERARLSRWLEAGGIRLEGLEDWATSPNPDLSWFREVLAAFPKEHRKSEVRDFDGEFQVPTAWKSQPTLFGV